MNLFDPELTSESLKLINDHTRMINQNLKDWIKMQKDLDSNIATEVMEHFSQVKGHQFKCTQNRKQLIHRLVKQGNGVKQMKAVIDFIVPEWTGTKMEGNLYPETIFAAQNFQKYLEQARVAYMERTNRTSVQLKEPKKPGNQYTDLLE